jgi:subtilisin-like proprotein convertase family protein
MALLAWAPQAGAATATFSNPTAMQDEFNDGAGALLPYPSVIDASGLTGTVSSVRVTVRGIAFQRTHDIDVLLAGPGGRRAIILKQVCGVQDSTTNQLTFTLAEDAAASVPSTATCVSGTFRPTVLGSTNFLYPFPGPQPTGLSHFAGVPPNGSWQLYALDTNIGNLSSITGGWSLQLTTTKPPKKCKKAKGKKASAAKKKRCKKKKR